MVIASRCRNASDEGSDWHAFIAGSRFGSVVAEEQKRLIALGQGTRAARLRDWCADGRIAIRSIYQGKGKGLYG